MKKTQGSRPPRRLGLAASLGHDRLNVVRQVRVAVLSTGDELRDPGTDLVPGEIYDANGMSLAIALADAHATIESVQVVSDDVASARAIILDEDTAAPFQEEWARSQDLHADEHSGNCDELSRINAGLGRLVALVEAGAATDDVTARLGELNVRRNVIEAELAHASPPAPRLRPNLATA